ncbi:zinc finger protein [Theobroma cacao]|uniref:RING-H2 finger protein ATL2J, putative n=2 Tax=Theobroma cacao TaxID=3641 RepID=A0A061ERT0_THECC|nr:PREDICTED: RING-H2 finger protein ATL33 [Theobroma cacao]EOY07551.1 RING-H2 finger protein ATL2J, putative [Theobroma cacao]WRX25277.1 zinc finger protein [Theobroma cacao]
MENSPTVIRPPPPPPQPPPSFVASPPVSQLDNTTNSTSIRSPPPLPFSSTPQIYPIDQNGTVSIVSSNPPPPFPDSPRSVDLSPLEFILALMAVITIPAIIYAFFFAVKCPPWTSRERPDSPRELPRDSRGSGVEVIERRREPVSAVKYQKETHSKDIGNECPVCLSVFADGEEVRQLSGCKHSFHATCIDMWLNNHNNCPVCRASVTVKRPNNHGTASGSARSRESDLQQGLPDATSLV